MGEVVEIDIAAGGSYPLVIGKRRWWSRRGRIELRARTDLTTGEVRLFVPPDALPLVREAAEADQTAGD